MTANSPELLIRLAAAPDYFAVADVRQGRLVRVLPDGCLPSQTVSAVFPGRKLMPAKTRAFIDTLQATFGGMSATARGSRQDSNSDCVECRNILITLIKLKSGMPAVPLFQIAEIKPR